MRKNLIIATLGMMLVPQVSEAQVHDDEKYLQW